MSPFVHEGIVSIVNCPHILDVNPVLFKELPLFGQNQVGPGFLTDDLIASKTDHIQLGLIDVGDYSVRPKNMVAHRSMTKEVSEPLFALSQRLVHLATLGKVSVYVSHLVALPATASNLEERGMLSAITVSFLRVLRHELAEEKSILD